MRFHLRFRCRCSPSHHPGRPDTSCTGRPQRLRPLRSPFHRARRSPIEANLRIGGAEVFDFHRMAYGVNLVEGGVRIALGLPVPRLRPIRAVTCGASTSSPRDLLPRRNPTRSEAPPSSRVLGNDILSQRRRSGSRSPRWIRLYRMDYGDRVDPGLGHTKSPRDIVADRSWGRR